MKKEYLIPGGVCCMILFCICLALGGFLMVGQVVSQTDLETPAGEHTSQNDTLYGNPTLYPEASAERFEYFLKNRGQLSEQDFKTYFEELKGQRVYMEAYIQETYSTGELYLYTAQEPKMRITLLGVPSNIVRKFNKDQKVVFDANFGAYKGGILETLTLDEPVIYSVANEKKN